LTRYVVASGNPPSLTGEEREMSDKVQFQTNIPVEVALKYGDGKEVNGQYGDQVLYTLTHGRVMYVPPIVKRRIEELGIGQGELFTLTKAEKKNGTRRTIEWVVAAGERGEKPPRGNVKAANSERPVQQHNGAAVSGNGNGHRANSNSDSKGFLVTNHGQLLLQWLAAAVDVAAATERYAAASRVELQFNNEDLREIGLRIYATGLK
jgi:hypothetical protein